MAQNVPNYVPTNGLVGWWPFNGNANDESGNGNHGTVNGATLTTDRNGVQNSAYSFNGFSSYVRIKNSKSLNNSSVGLSGWFKTSNLATDDFIGAKGIVSKWWQSPSMCNDNYNAFLICLTKPSNTNQTVIGAATDFYAGNNFTSISSVNLNMWTHFVFTHDKSGGKLYLNGILINLNNLKGEICNSINDLIIGADVNNGSIYRFFNGHLDDIAIYNRALTQEEITALYTSTPPCTNPSAVITPQGNTTFCQGGFVNLNASTGTNYKYEWYNNGQLINGATTSVYQATTSGNYTVKVIDGACNATSTATTVTVNPNPTATITAQGNTTFCEGGFVNLVASGGTSYQWNTGSSAATISATQSGTYTVNVFNSFGCQATASQQVNVNPLPNVTLNALNQFTLKNASPIQLVANPTGGTFSGEGVQGATFIPANVSLGKKTITYNYTSPQGCSGKASSNTFVVDSIGNVCNVTKYDTVKVTKTVYDTLKVNQTIYDTVKVTKTINDTVSILKVKFKLTTGIKANQYTTMNVYPNPTSDVIIIDASDVAALNGYSYKLFDVQGKEVYNALVTNVKTEISMKTFGKAGVYILHVVDANNVSIETKQIVLE